MGRTPAHAGRLSWWERLTFAGVFALMAAVVAVVAIFAGQPSPRPGPAVAAGRSATSPRGTAAASPAASPPPGSEAGTTDNSGQAARLDQQLAVVLQHLIAQQDGSLAIGVVDRTTGAHASYGGNIPLPAASIIRVDLLAALLLRHQAAAAMLNRSERELAARMIEGRGTSAAALLWRQVGWERGMELANARLRLRHTSAGRGRRWGPAVTTVRDQLQLMSDLTSARSPLDQASRSFVLGLMQRVPAAAAWGVTETATPGTVSAVEDGWLALAPHHWVIDSIGVVHHFGQVVQVAVLCDGARAEQAGVVLAERAAVLAVDEIVPAPPAGRSRRDIARRGKKAWLP